MFCACVVAPKIIIMKGAGILVDEDQNGSTTYKQVVLVCFSRDLAVIGDGRGRTTSR